MNEREPLAELARAHGIQASYTDGTGRRRQASRESVLAVLRQLGAPVVRAEDAAAALDERAISAWRQVAPPVVVARDGAPATVSLRLPRADLPRHVGARLTLEDGSVRDAGGSVGDLPTTGETTVGGESFVELALPLGSRVPPGYHALAIDAGRRAAECAVIGAPERAHEEPDGSEVADWGVFLPLHALWGGRSLGAGSYADLARLVEWTADLGGRAVGTLPLLPTWLDEPCEPSPYMPVSRLFWSELPIALDDLPEAGAPRAATATLRRRIDRLRAAPEVDHREQAALQRSVLERAARELHEDGSRRSADLRAFVREHPEIARYARFRAVRERLGRPWRSWPDRLRRGRLDPQDCEPSIERYHAFCQWSASTQIAAVARSARARGARLCLDLPLGVHPDGYDTWRYPGLFADGASAGAPPDAFFVRGQCWGLPPIAPRASQRDGHRYFAACLRHHMRHAGLLRIDHVMSLHRLFWIPEGHDPADGVYVRYPTEELYAALCLESRRHHCVVVGEDLGTVPRDVRPTMRRHGLRRTCVVRFEPAADPERPLLSMRIDGVASLQTHDMPTFAGFWRGIDIGLRRRLGHLSAEEAAREREARRRQKAAWLRDLRRGGWLKSRKPGTTEVLRACLALLADSPAELVLVDLEDLWLETRPQNVPGTTDEWPNWRRKARYPLEVFATLPRVSRALRDVERRRAARRGGRGERR